MHLIMLYHWYIDYVLKDGWIYNLKYFFKKKKLDGISSLKLKNWKKKKGNYFP